MDKSAIAKRNFLSGMNCAQSVLCAFETECGLDHETALKLASGFGAADLIFGPADPADKTAKDAHYATLQKLADQFRQETGSIICRVMLGLEKPGPDSPVSEARTASYYRKRPCAELCALAAGILENHLKNEIH